MQEAIYRASLQTSDVVLPPCKPPNLAREKSFGESMFEFERKRIDDKKLKRFTKRVVSTFDFTVGKLTA